jgi:epoxyqueuosine reductase
LLDDASALVRGAAVWAVAQLIEPEKFAALRGNALSMESNEDVRQEWLAAS